MILIWNYYRQRSPVGIEPSKLSPMCWILWHILKSTRLLFAFPNKTLWQATQNKFNAEQISNRWERKHIRIDSAAPKQKTTINLIIIINFWFHHDDKIISQTFDSLSFIRLFLFISFQFQFQIWSENMRFYILFIRQDDAMRCDVLPKTSMVVRRC